MTIQIDKLSVPRFARVLLGVTLAGVVAILSGCATAPPPAKEIRLVWPEPPEKTHIEFVRAITSDEDLTKDTTKSQSILKFLEGEKPAKYRIVNPEGIAISDDGDRMYVSDVAQGAVFVFNFATKSILKIGEDKPLAMPMGIAVDEKENIYVVEQSKKGVSVFDREGKPLRFITDASLIRPTGIAIDKARGKIYVADTSHSGNNDHSVKVFDLQGKMLGKVGRGRGNAEGAFLFPTYVTVDSEGNLYVADTVNARVQVFDADGKFLRVIGRAGTAFGMFDKPKGVAVDSFGIAYVVDSGWSNVQMFNTKGQVLLYFGGRGTYPGLMQNPATIAIDKKNRIYVGDVINHRVNVYQLVNTTKADATPKEDDPAKKEDASVKKEDTPTKAEEVPAK